ncbi:unnamed protein product [Citrullus colocynthis]|uniref:Uncharacterized protein n=1 Tax=Citrullus colocynthis TaxID=252529 RepID=A0ABP0Z4E7_9ROSI
MMDEGFAVHILGNITNETFDIPLTINGERRTLISGEEKIRKSINEDAVTKPQEFNSIEREGGFLKGDPTRRNSRRQKGREGNFD